MKTRFPKFVFSQIQLVPLHLGFVLLKNTVKDPNQKDPLWIKSLVIFHNVFLVSLSLHMCGG